MSAALSAAAEDPWHVFRGHFGFGDRVYLRAREDADPGYVTGVLFRPSGASYGVTWGDRTETFHFEFELSPNPEYS